MAYAKIGIIGGGTIGRAVYDHIVAHDLAEVAYVLVSGKSPRAQDDDGAVPIVADAREALSREVDLVVEAAHPDIVVALGTKILERADLCCFSCSALHDRPTEEAILAAAAAHGTRFLLPHGAVFGLDGLVDGRDILDEVVITTTKSDVGLGLEKGTSGVVFDGPTREVCKRFPRNVNVHAAIALAGIGFDRTRSVIVAEPGSPLMRHRIQVSGQGLDWEVAISSKSLGGVTGAYTPKSAIGSVRRILGLGAFANV